MVKEADIVFVVSEKLLERAKKINHNSCQMRDGTVPELFVNSDKGPPDEIKTIPHPILGYAGTVFTRLDLDLIAELSIKFPQCSIVLIGNILLSPEKIIKIRQKNIFLLGGKKYEELPDFMMHFDVCILPYIYELSLMIFPTKIYDYLATGKPIVSTYLPELEDFSNCVKLARTREEFIGLINGALNENDADLRKRRIEMAKKNSWFARTDEIMGMIRKRP